MTMRTPSLWIARWLPAAVKGTLFPLDSNSEEIALAPGTDGQLLTADSAADEGVSWQDPGTPAAVNIAIPLVIGDGVNVITTGVKGYVEVPFNAIITVVHLVADASGSIVLDIWKDTYANFPPTVADTITAAAKPTLASAQKYQNTTLTGWTTAIAAGDWLGINVDSATTVKQVTLSLTIQRT